jgi:hypothetical protein
MQLAKSDQGMEDHDPLPALRRDVVLAMREFNAANKDLTRLFGRLEVVTRNTVAQIQQGKRALDIARSMRLADRRETLNAAAARVRQGRHDLQLAMFRLAEAEGASRAEIARTWRVSRQLVSRMTRKKGKVV